MTFFDPRVSPFLGIAIGVVVGAGLVMIWSNRGLLVGRSATESTARKAGNEWARERLERRWLHLSGGQKQ